MQIHYLEIVTADADATCKAYAAASGLQFDAPDSRLGGARTATLPGGGRVGIRPPMHRSEAPVVRPYWLVDDLEQAVAAVVGSGAELIHPPLEIPGLGQFAIHALGGNQHGLWQR